MIIKIFSQPTLCPLPQTPLTGLSVNPSCALPGDTLNSLVDTSFSENTITLSTQETSSTSVSNHCLLTSNISAMIDSNIKLQLANQLANQLPDYVHVSAQIEMVSTGPRGRGSSVSVGEGATVCSGAPLAHSDGGSHGPMQQFFTKLRRHASLEGASPYLKIKKWKLDSSQRASSLDTRGN